jgi:uncharacterized cofD-like protein
MAGLDHSRRPLRIVGLGGGKGLATLLGGLRRVAGRARRAHGAALEITGIVSVADDGGSSGRLRHELGIPAVGDLRNCLVALSRGDALWRDLFQHRFTDGDHLGGHALGNLVMAALTQRAGGLTAAIEQLSRPLRLRGRLLPVTEQWVQLEASRVDGRRVRGESSIPVEREPIADVWLVPRRVPPAPGVVDAIAAADAVVLGPGSLFTSVVPNLLVDGVAEAVRGSRALRIFVCNLMTQPGETDDFEPADHLRRLERYLGPGAIDVCLLNRRLPPPDLVERYAAAGSRPVAGDPRQVAACGVLPVVDELLDSDRSTVRHDETRLAELIVSMARCLRRHPSAEAASAALELPIAAPRAIAVGYE